MRPEEHEGERMKRIGHLQPAEAEVETAHTLFGRQYSTPLGAERGPFCTPKMPVKEQMEGICEADEDWAGLESSAFSGEKRGVGARRGEGDLSSPQRASRGGVSERRCGEEMEVGRGSRSLDPNVGGIASKNHASPAESAEEGEAMFLLSLGRRAAVSKVGCPETKNGSEQLEASPRVPPRPTAPFVNPPGPPFGRVNQTLDEPLVQQTHYDGNGDALSDELFAREGRAKRKGSLGSKGQLNLPLESITKEALAREHRTEVGFRARVTEPVYRRPVVGAAAVAPRSCTAHLGSRGGPYAWTGKVADAAYGDTFSHRSRSKDADSDGVGREKAWNDLPSAGEHVDVGRGRNKMQGESGRRETEILRERVGRVGQEEVPSCHDGTFGAAVGGISQKSRSRVMKVMHFSGPPIKTEHKKLPTDTDCGAQMNVE
jgi:hypothetical protein